MKKIIISIIVIVCVGLVLARFFFPWRTSAPAPLPIVSVSPVLRQAITVKTETLGIVEPYASVEIKSMVTGPLLKIGFHEGDMVKKGQLLFEIDPRPFAALIAQTKAALSRDQASLVKDQMLLKRHGVLVTKGYTSKQDYETFSANVLAMMATVKADEASLQQAELQLEYATIRAPMDGKTGNITLKLGSVVKANDTIPLVVINQINPIYVSFTLAQNRLPAIQSAIRRGNIAVNAFQQNKLIEKGKLVFINNHVDAATGTIQLKAVFDNNAHLLWPGQHVTVDLAIDYREHAILIPSLALMTSQRGFYVYVVGSDSIIHQRDVIPGPVIKQMTIIEKGLTAGESVVTSGQLRIQEGMKVSVHTTP